ncbi:acyl-CoA thioesterase [Brachybacterium paraconglomeratum]|uniref:Acyl-CoA thioesterase II n=1 Tax=Brachybacterium paraconglomeratum TaxID=173362 RepID=A0A921KSS5_9MICO|nr:acyl-CoA thioesterase II [Brachybacterium paraconglomeratum]MCT1436215.1 acyl-CoA thioesterase II [Brachybacterium paraconglomeratum]MDV3295078.1 acyl-CoA thioesterase II [Brachybacterium paraconglomeratum]HJF50111.1 acyl-CoA thioesterase II [Brachybacterium paraconglomeratum]
MTASNPDHARIAAGLVDLLDLRPVDAAGAASSPTAIAVYEGDSSPQPGGHVFGGQVMGQAVTAVGRTVPEGRRIHSMYSYFLAPGDPAHPIRFEVDALRDGGSFSVRRVLATQPGRTEEEGERTILAMTASFQEEQEGLEHAEHAPEAPDPEGLPTTAEVLAGIEHPVAEYWSTQRPIDIRHVTDPIYLRPDANGGTIDAQMVWMRTLAPVDADPLLHDAILAFASDYTPFEPILRKQGLSWMTPGLKMATIDHAIWWHRHVRADEWLLYVQRSPSASGGRGLTHGQIFDRSGELVATVTQEGMIRAPRRG